MCVLWSTSCLHAAWDECVTFHFISLLVAVSLSLSFFLFCSPTLIHSVCDTFISISTFIRHGRSFVRSFVGSDEEIRVEIYWCGLTDCEYFECDTNVVEHEHWLEFYVDECCVLYTETVLIPPTANCDSIDVWVVQTSANRKTTNSLHKHESQFSKNWC